MAEPWNLTPQEWSKVLKDDQGADAAKTAKRLVSGHVLPWVDVLIRFTQDSRQVLDLGCGHGENSAVLALNGKVPTLVDWSEDNLEFCRRLFDAIGQQAHYVQADITKPLAFADRSFDAVFSCGVFEYFTDD